MKLKLQTRRLCLALAAAAVLAGGWLAIQAAPKPQAADTPAVQTAASAAAPVRTIGYTLVPLPQTDEKEAVAPADNPAAEEAPEEAPAPEEAVAPEDDAAGDPNAVPDDLELLDTFLATAYCQTGTTASESNRYFADGYRLLMEQQLRTSEKRCLRDTASFLKRCHSRQLKKTLICGLAILPK